MPLLGYLIYRPVTIPTQFPTAVISSIVSLAGEESGDLEMDDVLEVLDDVDERIVDNKEEHSFESTITDSESTNSESNSI